MEPPRGQSIDTGPIRDKGGAGNCPVIPRELGKGTDGSLVSVRRHDGHRTFLLRVDGTEGMDGHDATLPYPVCGLSRQHTLTTELTVVK
jgi:hypothetical protein